MSTYPFRLAKSQKGSARPKYPVFHERPNRTGPGIVHRGEGKAAERHFLKYEWRDTLCRMGIVDCRWSRNRFWNDDEDGYAPYPPGRLRGRIE